MKVIKHVLGAAAIVSTLFFSQYAVAEKASPTANAQPTQAVVLTEKVNINTADATALKRVLLGIGQKKAEAIVQYREQHGAFMAPEQLLEVKGFGKATLEKNRDRIEL